jgi:hypothetical protein
MKKIVLNISDSTYEKIRFEAIQEKKGIPEVIHDRILYKPFHSQIEEAFSSWLDLEIEKIIKE